MRHTFTLVLTSLVAVSGSYAQQTPLVTTPNSSQTVTQPSNTQLNVDGVLNVGFANPDSYLRVASALRISSPDEGDSASITLLGGQDLNVDASRGTGNVSLYLSGDNAMNFQVFDNGGEFSNYNSAASVVFLCASTDQDFVGVGGTGCNPFDIFDVSNRETFGNGYMHWFQDGAHIYNWNAGISNPSAGLLSLDSNVNGNGLGALQLETMKFMSPGPNITFGDGSIQSTAWNGTTFGGDYAEAVDVTGSREEYETGDLIAIDRLTPGQFTKTTTPYSRLISGVYSTKPGLTGRRANYPRPNEKNELPMAMMGVAPVKVCAENGPIAPGDLLVSSSQSGYAMRGTDATKMLGAVIGKAMDSLSEGKGKIEVLIVLQ